jgi:hypothetical protein
LDNNLDDLHDQYGYVVYFDPENDLAVGVLLEDRVIKIYYLNRNDKGDFGPYEVVTDEDISYEMLVTDFPESLINSDNAECWLREDPMDDDAQEFLEIGNKELEFKSFKVLGMI